ncbi:MAG: hypothetical protein GY950_36200, partial [bacterium]|nr:hypothetical protein [bacterium]
MNRRLRFIVFFVVLAVVVCAWGEGKSKKEKLRDYYRQTQEDMREAYDNGDLEEVIRLYRDNCLKNGKEKKTFKKMSKEIRTGIYQLVLRSYTALDRPDLGDVFLRKLLILRREEGTGDYWLSIRNTALAKYIVAPRLLVGLTAGANFSRVQPGARYSILELASDTGVNHEKEYDFHFKHSRGTQLGIIIEYSLTRRFS